MGECRFRPRADVPFNRLPRVLFIANLLAIRTYGEEAFELCHFRMEREDPFGDPKACRQFVHIDRFIQEVVRTGFHPFIVVFLSSQGGEKDDIGILLLNMRPDHPAQIQTVNLRHHPVRDDELGPFRQERTPCSFAIFRGNDFVPHLPELGKQDQPGYIVVFGNEDFHGSYLA